MMQWGESLFSVYVSLERFHKVLFAFEFTSNKATTMRSVCCYVVWLSNRSCQKKPDWNAVNICKNIIIMANRCRSFVKCLHLKVPTLKPRYEWIYEIGDETTTTATTAVYWNSGRLYIVFVILVTLFFCIKTLHDWENLARI